jgi:hypothetical protein
MRGKRARSASGLMLDSDRITRVMLCDTNTYQYPILIMIMILKICLRIVPHGDQHGFMHDMLNAAISEIDWRDIAEHYVDDVVDELELIKDDAKSELMGV